MSVLSGSGPPAGSLGRGQFILRQITGIWLDPKECARPAKFGGSMGRDGVDLNGRKALKEIPLTRVRAGELATANQVAKPIQVVLNPHIPAVPFSELTQRLQ